jgi:hypothetical protein
MARAKTKNAAEKGDGSTLGFEASFGAPPTSCAATWTQQKV